MSAQELLEPYRSLMRDERHQALACRLLDWCLQHFRREAPAALARRVYVASTFDVYCSPPEATLEENVLGSQFLVTFLAADDGPPEELTSFLAEAEDSSPTPTDLRACHDAWLEALHQRGRDTRGLRAAFRRMCEWFQLERQLEPSTLTEERYRELRRNTIAVNIYAACWAAIRALSPSERADEALRRSNLLELTSELVYIVNDLGSLERDEEAARQHQPDSELNLVLLRARALGSRQEALRQVLALYHERLQDFRRRRAELAGSEHWRERSVRDYVELLRCISNGNLAGTRHLMTTRYPGAQALLGGLPDVEPAGG
jgi:hypothetical protein